MMASYLSMNKGTQTGTRATMHDFLHRNHTDEFDASDTVLYGPSTSNQVSSVISIVFCALYALPLRLLWLFSPLMKEIHERLEVLFKAQLRELKGDNLYDHNEEKDSQWILGYLTPT